MGALICFEYNLTQPDGLWLSSFSRAVSLLEELCPILAFPWSRNVFALGLHPQLSRLAQL